LLYYTEGWVARSELCEGRAEPKLTAPYNRFNAQCMQEIIMFEDKRFRPSFAWFFALTKTCPTVALVALLSHAALAKDPPQEKKEKQTNPSPIITWREYEEGRKESKQKNLPTLILFGGRNDYYTRKFKEVSFTNQGMLMLLEREIIPVFVEEGENGAWKYKVEIFPTVIVNDSKGQILGRTEGFLEGKKLEKAVRDFLKKK
jgi:thioredoxin-related protein